jgi:hypothetical protein
MIVIGSHNDTKKGLVTLAEPDLLYHTAIIGQSGSGKSFFISRFIEEIILRTRARVLVIDPNGDFVNSYLPQPDSFWTSAHIASEFSRLNDLESKTIRSFETKSAFVYDWSRRQFQILTPDIKIENQILPNVNIAPLKLHWKELDYEQDFFLDLDPKIYPKLYQGYITCVHYIEEGFSKDHPNGYAIEDLEEIANNFAGHKIAMGSLSTASTTLSAGAILTDDDWVSVRLMLRDLRKRFNRLWHIGALKGKSKLLPDLTDFVKNGFKAHPWDACIMGLNGLLLNENLFAVNSALNEISKECAKRWASVKRREAALHQKNTLGQQPESTSQGAMSKIDDRSPTFVIIDEAHNFAPEEPINALQKHVSDRIATIAAEGRKYGLFLVLATQRPTKLRRGLLSECENVSLLRIQSKTERSRAAKALGIPSDTVDQVSTFPSGTALMHGPWVPGSLTVKSAPARSLLGGAGIDPTSWIGRP